LAATAEEMSAQSDQLRRLMAVFKQYAVDEAPRVAPRRPTVLKNAASARPVRTVGLSADSTPDETKFTRF
jgi:hypothetical protein